MSTLASFRKRLRKAVRTVLPQDRSYGTAIRDVIHHVALTAHPYVVKVIPNFRAAHYTYILFMSFFMSVIVYPITRFRYVDILFLMSGALTQAGLNTVNLNELRLSQQILVYITTMLTTPIFIHGLLLFIRLYWFERYFDNIKELSKLNFKMRRNATIAARTRSTDRTAANTMNNKAIGTVTGDLARRVNLEKPSGTCTSHTVVENTHTTSSSDPLADPKHKTGLSSSKQSKMTRQGDDLGHTTYIDPSDDEGLSNSGSGKDPASLTATSPRGTPANDGIKFVDLPKPSKRIQEVDPSDMYKSIALLQQNKRKDSGLDDHVLVIKSPKEIERNSNTPIFTTKDHHGRFPVIRSPSKWRVGRLNKGKNRWNALKTTISNSSPVTRRRFTLPMGQDHRNSNGVNRGNNNGNRNNHDHHNDNVSIDSELDDAGDNDDSDDEVLVTPASRECHDLGEDENIHSSNLSEAGKDCAAGYSEDDTLVKETPTKSLCRESFEGDRKTKIAQESTIDRQKRQIRHEGRRRLRKWRTPIVSSLASRTTIDNNHMLHNDEDDEDIDDRNDDDEEDDLNGSGGAPLSKVLSTNYFLWTPTIGRNSTFVHLTDEQKEELGGVEYRAIKLLIKIIVFYYVGFHVMAFCLYVGFINVATGYAQDMRDFGLSPTWWGFFTAQSVFNDLGLTLTPNSMYTYSRNVYVLVISSFFIVIGNTGFPVSLRFIIWVMFKTAKPLSLYKESLGFLLDHPRRCFTLLFPSIPTWWLFFILVVLNAIDLILFIILDLNTKYLEAIPIGFRILDGLFQAFSTRTAGFSVLDLSQLHAAVQVSYMIMMYISVLPLAISIRRTNVYEEQSLGVYLKGEETNPEGDKTSKSFVGTHLRNQLSFDLWFIFLGLFIICIAEGGKILAGDLRFNVFAILFEIISAYGTVGLSLGYPDVNQSLSYRFTTFSKLVIIAMMIRGRHRGLPYALDRAIMIPNANMRKRDIVQENHAIQGAGSLSVEPTTTSNNDATSGSSRLRRTISRKAQQYRRNSLFPAPTKLADELHELRNLNRAHSTC